MMKLIFRYHWLRVSRHFKTRRLAKAITAFLFFLVIGAVAYGIYEFFRRGFLFLVSDPALKTVLPFYVYELFLLVVAYLVFVSALITGFFVFFRGRDDDWVMAAPGFKFLYVSGYARVFLSSLWPLLVIALPALLAIGSVFHFGAAGFFLALSAVAVLVAFIALLASIFLIAAARMIQLTTAAGSPMFGRLAAFAVIVLVLISSGVWHRVTFVSLQDLLLAENRTVITANVGAVRDKFGIFPSHFAAAAILGAQNGRLGEAAASVVILILLTSGAGLIFWLFSAWYLRLWQALQEGRFEAGVRTAAGRRRFLGYFHGPFAALFAKEALVMFRGLRNVLWLGFLFLILLAQVVLNLFMKADMQRHGHPEPGAILGAIQALQAATIIFIIGAFVLRFALPSFSTERRTSWIIASAPLDLSRLFLAKFLFFVSVFLALGFFVGLINVSALGIPVAAGGIFFIFTALAVVFLTAFGLSLGALFPNFDTDDPEALSTSFPGLFFTFGALLYNGLSVFFLYIFITAGMSAPLIGFEIISVLASALYVWLTMRALRRFEFVRVIE